MTNPSEDLILLQRFLDGELSEVTHRAFQQRLDSEPALAEACVAARSLGDCFAKGRDQVVATPAGLVGGVMDQVRKQPNREDLARLEDGSLPTSHEETGSTLASADRGAARHEPMGELIRATQFARRLAVAALLILGFGLLVLSGLFGGDRAASLEAAPDVLKQKMEDLDVRIRAEEAAGEPRGPR